MWTNCTAPLGGTCLHLAIQRLISVLLIWWFSLKNLSGFDGSCLCNSRIEAQSDTTTCSLQCRGGKDWNFHWVLQTHWWYHEWQSQGVLCVWNCSGNEEVRKATGKNNFLSLFSVVGRWWFRRMFNIFTSTSAWMILFPPKSLNMPNVNLSKSTILFLWLTFKI